MLSHSITPPTETMLGWVFVTIGSLFNTGTPKKVAFIGPAVSGAGKVRRHMAIASSELILVPWQTLVDHLKSGQYVVKKGSIYPGLFPQILLE